MLDPSRQAHAHADRRLRSEQVAWLTTVRADGQAQSTPVWFLWDGETFLLYSQPGAQKVRNVAANPKVSLHLGDDGAGGDVVTFEGTATVEPGHPAGRPGGGVPGQVPGGDRGPRVRAGAVRPHLLDAPSGSARPGSGSGSAVALLPEIRALLDQMAAWGRPPLHRQSVAQARAFHVEDAPALNGPAAPVASVGRPGRARAGRGAAGAGLHPRGRAAVPDRGLVPRRRLGGRDPRHLRPAVPGPGRGRAGGGRVGRLPAGARAPLAGRGRGRLRGHPVGVAQRGRAGRRPAPAGRGRRQRRREPGRGGRPRAPATGAGHRSPSSCWSTRCWTRPPTPPPGASTPRAST